MKRFINILLLSALCVATALAQGRGSRSTRGGFSLSALSAAKKDIPDSLLLADTASANGKRITAYQLDSRLGQRRVAPMDTGRLNTANSFLAESKALALGFLANVGSPAQSKIFFDREEERDFIFADAYTYYITTPDNALFYDTKTPYTNVSYSTGGASQSKEDRLKGVMTMNFGKRINVGGDIDYIYSRGHYDSNGNKMLSYRLFGNYLSDRYEMSAYLSNFNFVSYENGGLTDDRYITDIDNLSTGQYSTDTKSFPVRFTDAWNRVRGKRYFLTHRYNLGFTRELDETDEDGNPKSIFVPVSSIIHTFDYEDNRRRFISENAGIDTCYNRVYGIDNTLNDQASSWIMKNTFALALREGFQDWVKFGLNAFIRFEKRKFRLPAEIPGLDYSP